MEKDNTTRVLTRFMAQLGIPVTRQSISDELEKHPDYGSMLAYSDVLNNWHVPNDAYKVPFDQLTEVPLPFIAFLKDKEFAVVSALDGQQATLSHHRWNKKTLPLAGFKKIYNNSILVAEKSEYRAEPGYAHKRQKELVNDLRMPVFFAGALIVLLGFLLLHSAYVSTLNFPIAFLTLFKTTGLATTVLLLVQSIDANNPIIQKLCGGDDKKDCNAILSSNAAKVNDYLTWSEAGFFYFAGTWLVLLFNSGHTAIMQALALLNVICLPYTFYSIYFQWRVVKQWCVFCCTVQAVLWLEFFAFLPYLLHGVHGLALNECASLAMGTAIPVLVWLLIKPYLLQAAQLAPVTMQLQLFKYNKELFEAVLKNQPKFALPDDDWSIVLGNVEANNIITMVTNPYCEPCAKAHAQLDEALNNLENIQVRIVFVGKNNSNVKDTKTQVHRHLMALNTLPDKTIIKRALHDWYAQKQKNYEAWAKAYPVTLEESQYIN